jgi:hypothetical protein
MTGEDVLLNKIVSGKSPQLVTFTPHSETKNPEEYLNTWLTAFLTKYLSKIKNISQEHASSLLANTHPDIVLIKKPESGKKYTISNNDLSDFFSVQQYKNWELPTRIIAIERVDLIPETYANKMLKTLEEPTPGTITFLLNPLNKKCLRTIESRSISMRLKSPLKIKHQKIEKQNKIQYLLNQFTEDSQKHDLLSDVLLKNKNTHKLAQALKEDHDFKDNLFRLLIDTQSKVSDHFLTNEGFLKELNWFWHSSTYNGLEIERFYGLIAAFKRQDSRQKPDLGAY